MGTLAGIRREVEAMVRQQMERVLASLDLVTRDEFDAVKEMAVRARADQEALEARIAALEMAAAKSARARPASRGKTAAAKTGRPKKATPRKTR